MIIPKKIFGIFTLIVFSACVFLFSRGFGQWLATLFVAQGPIVPFTTHVVLFQFKDGTSAFAIKEVTSKFIALKKACVHPYTRRPYIVSISGGKDISIENLQAGVSHAFIVQFRSNQDRDYYVKEDPVHQAFKKAVETVLEKTLVVDFQDGVFTNAESL